jgi:hypothetical protein
MSSTAAPHNGGTTLIAGMSPAELYARVVGVVLVLAGIVGFFADASFHTGTPPSSHPLLGLDVNGFHNVVHILTGLLLLGFARNARSARTGVLIFAVAYLVVTIYGFVAGDNVLGIVPINTPDNFLHLVLTIVAFGAYALTKPDAADGPGAVRR